jgi:hypothetical protein
VRSIPSVKDVARPELISRALEQISRHTPERSRDAEARLWAALELLPVELDWETALQTALQLRLQAFYDPDSQSVFLDRGLAPGARRRVLAHELVHALTDQHFALAARLSDASASEDARAALLSIAEGDADALVTTLWDAASPDADDAVPGAISDTFGDASSAPELLPEVVSRALAAAYVDGAAAVRRQLADGGWRAVDGLYREPPRSTHELLHGDPTPSAPLAAGELPAGLTQTYADVLGEQTWRTVLESWLPLDAAAQLASAWRGDRLSLVESSSQRALVWEVRSNVLHATESAAAARRGLRLPAPSHAARARDFACRAHRDHGALAAWRDGPSLFLTWLESKLEATPASTQCNTLLDWAAATTRRVPEALDPGPARLIGPTRPNPGGNGSAPR